MEGASHCVYLGCIFAQSLALLSLDWILTFSSFRFRFPCAVFKVHARLPQPFGLSQLRGCGTVVSSPLVGLTASLGRAPPPPPVCFASELLKVLHFFRSFKTIQCFNQEFSQFRLQLFAAVALATLFSLHLSSCFTRFDVRPRIRLSVLNHFSLERR